MSADELAAALGGRRTPRGWRARCPGHEDRHPSLDIEERDGRVLFIDRSGRCSQTEILEALRARGLCAQRDAAYRPRREPFRWDEYVPPEPPAIADCCLAGGCEHWRRFDIEFTAARLTSYLVEAAAEMIQLFKVAQMELGADELRAELADVVAWNPEKQTIEQYLDVEQVREAVDAVVRGAMW